MLLLLLLLILRIMLLLLLLRMRMHGPHGRLRRYPTERGGLLGRNE